MDIGYPHAHDLGAQNLGTQNRGTHHETGPDETDQLWAEHGWALSGPQVGIALAVILAASVLGTLLG